MKGTKEVNLKMHHFVYFVPA